MNEISGWLRHFEFLGGLKEEARAMISSVAERRVAMAGEIVCDEGEPGSDLFFLEAGRVEGVRDLAGRDERRLAVLDGPDVFGEMAIIECAVRSATVRASALCQIWVFGNAEMHELFNRWPDQYAILLHRLARTMAGRLREEAKLFRGVPVTRG